jgi:hypothetical protein
VGEGQEYQLIATAAVDGDDGLARRVQSDHPRARELDKIAAAYAARAGVSHRLWLDEPAGVLLYLERAAIGNGAAERTRLYRIALRSASCTRVLADLTAAVLERLASPADSYQARSEVDRDIGALIQLFRVQLARMRTEHSRPAELVQAIHAHIGRSGDERQAARREVFLGWYLERTYGKGGGGRERAEEDLGRDIAEVTRTGQLKIVGRTIMDWSWYRYLIRCKVPWSELHQVPRGKGYGRNTHWYYEFRVLGRHLTELQMLELRADLPWAVTTPDSLILDRWGERDHPAFRSDKDIVRQYFDAGLHFSQEGLRTLWLRLPATFAEQAAPYTTGSGVTTTIVGDDLVLELHREEADGENSYVNFDPRPWLEELLPLRDDLARGDLRALAIAWRAANVTLAYTKESQMPPMPGRLDEDELNPQLHALTRFLEETP